MTATSLKQASYRILPISIGIWLIAFMSLKVLGQSIPEFDRRIAIFFSATLLTGLSIGIVYGFSRLKLNRSIYLLIGALAIAGIYLAATPLVKRNDTINISGEIPGQIMMLSFQSVLIQPQIEKVFMPVRNSLFSVITNFVAKELKEPVSLILLLSLAQLTLASGIGLWIAEGIDDITHLIPVALVATIADIWSVSAGATAKIVVSSSINYFLLRFPLPAFDAIPYLIGLTDFLFFAIFFQAAIRYNLGALKNSILLASSFIIAIVSALFTSTGLPVLPFMAVLFVVGNFSKLEFKKEELKQVLIFVLVILVLFAFISLKIR